MDFFKNFGLQGLILLVPGILQQLGNSFKNKDDNTTGNDDALGNVFIGIGQAIPGALTGNEKLIVKALTGIRDTINSYLDSRQPEPKK